MKIYKLPGGVQYKIAFITIALNDNRSGWFRIFGKGLSWKKGLCFSERMGKTRYVKVGQWVIKFLNENNF